MSTRNIFPAILIVVTILTIPAGADELINRVTACKGTVRYESPKEESTVLGLRQFVKKGGTIRTGKGGQLTLKFADHRSQSIARSGTSISFGPETTAKYGSGEINRKIRTLVLFLDKGSAVVQIPSSSRRYYSGEESFIEIITPASRIRSNKADFSVAVTDRGTTVRSIDGEVLIWEPQNIPPVVYGLKKGKLYFSEKP